jgi:hypothetical protein
MDNKELFEHIKAVYAELKDFQRASVENVFEKLYKEGKKRFLIADEVGLGKTIVAKGLIAKAMERHLKSSRKDQPFRVIYICSNQALTGQNLKKLNIFKKKEFLEIDRGRLIFQAFKPKNTGIFQVSSLTPSTSFRLIKGTGIADERKLIYTILANYDVFTKGKRNNGLKLTLLGNVEYKYIDWWKSNLEGYYNENVKKLRQGITSNYKAKIASTEINVDELYYRPIATELGFKGFVSIQSILIAYSDLLYVGNIKNYEGQKRLLGKLRQILTEICLEFVEADLYILDEFQRFKDLISTSNTQISDASEIAKRVFETPKAKVLLLSATPFKPFTTSAEAEFDEDHHKEFKEVLNFLFNKEPGKLEEYEKNRKVFFELLRRPENFAESNLKEKRDLENLYREVLSRTERLIVSDDKNTLIKDSDIKLQIIKDDLINFIQTDKIIEALNEETKKNYNSLVDFCKSAPYPLSFMDQYKVKEDLKKLIRKNKAIKKITKSSNHAWLDLDRVMDYKSLGTIPNAAIRELMTHSIDNNMYKLLWMPPNLPYYGGEGYFKDQINLSKVLVFSKWRMVPRAIASIISYEAEQRTIGNPKIKVEGEKKYLPDFYENNKKKRQPRKPGKLLAVRLKEGAPQSMSIFNLIYPSITLSNCFSPSENIKLEKPLLIDEIKSLVKNQIADLIKESGIESYKNGSSITRNWYWVAPLLLDKHFHNKIYNKWFKDKMFRNSSFASAKGSNIDIDDVVDLKSEGKAATAHLDELFAVFDDPTCITLGEFPEDLFEVLAMQVIAAPGLVSLRILSECFPKIQLSDILNRSLDIASHFHSLFDKPESIAIIKLSQIDKRLKTSNNYYWKEVLNYCCDGNLQSVMDEFTHLVLPECNSIDEFVIRIANAANMRTASLSIDNADTLLGIDGKKSMSMRCHYAVDFGNQDMDKEEGVNRIKSILDNFNSPFRPFVLASTSVGQEGLDFHYYCRKVMHWNLPSNPIDIEQREGRVNRYKGLVVRQNLIKKYHLQLKYCTTNYWNFLFNHAAKEEGEKLNKPELVPYWHVEPDGIHIERIIPMIPFSREFSKYESLMATLTLYRLTFGQPRQEELVKTLMNNFGEKVIAEIRNNLMINLSPISYNKFG